MTGLSAVAVKAASLERLARFRRQYPGVPVLHKTIGPLSYTCEGPVRGRDLGDLLDKLDEIYPPLAADRGG